jgi:transcriptional regulator with XRE-family HTH domain
MDDVDGMAERLRTIRRLHGLTQEELAVAAGVSKSLISKVEAGQKPGSWALAVAVGRAVRVDPVALIGRAAPADSDDERAAAALPDLRRAVVAYDDPGDPIGAPRGLRALSDDVERLNRLRLDANYAQLAEQLPPLLAELSRTVHEGTGDDRRRAFWLLAAAYRCGDAVAFKLGHMDLSALITERIRWAAEYSDDDLMVGTAAYVRGQTYLVNKAWGPGLRALTAAGQPLSRRASTDPRAAAVYGAVHMRAAVVAARGQMAEAAWSHMQLAAAAADVVGRDVEWYYTSFGPSNVKIHETAVAVELGDSAEALRRAGAWQPSGAVPAERASHWLIDLARAQVWGGLYREAAGSLMQARTRAPQHTRTNPLARQSVRAILRRGGRPSSEVAGLATWLGIAV